MLLLHKDQYSYKSILFPRAYGQKKWREKTLAPPGRTMGSHRRCRGCTKTSYKTEYFIQLYYLGRKRGQWKKILQSWRASIILCPVHHCSVDRFSGFGKSKGSSKWSGSLICCCLVAAETILFVNTIQDSRQLGLKLDVYPPAAFPTGSFHIIKKKMWVDFYPRGHLRTQQLCAIKKHSV